MSRKLAIVVAALVVVHRGGAHGIRSAAIAVPGGLLRPR